MLNLFMILSHLSNIIAVLTGFIFLIGVCSNSELMCDSDIHRSCLRQIKSCKSAAFLFSLFVGAISSCMPPKECSAYYAALSVFAGIYGCVFIISGLCAVIIGFIVKLKRKGRDAADFVQKIRRTSFFTGVFSAAVACILKVY